MKKLIVILLLAFALPAFAAEETKQEPAKTDYKDAFLKLALEKSKLYSGKVEDAIGQGVEMAKKEVPELAKEWITWRFYYHLWFVIMPIIVILVSVLVFGFCFYKSGKEGYGESGWGVLTIVTGFCGAIAIIMACAHLCCEDHVIKLIQINTAPRIYMIEEVAKLIRK